MTLGAGSYVFREGDPGRDLFLVARGAVYVLGGEAIIDQLGTGAIFGEFAALVPDVAHDRAACSGGA